MTTSLNGTNLASSDLQPVFAIQVSLDGDDDTDILTEDIKTYLINELERMKQNGYFLDYTVTVSR